MFFCNSPIPEAEASVEHLIASAGGGTNDDSNCVVCRRTLRAVLAINAVMFVVEFTQADAKGGA